jgi:hypothetical protein
MTYASIQEVWGGISGSNQLSTPLTEKRHPIHEQQLQRRQKYPTPREHTSKDLYQCKYGSHDCEQVFKENQVFNNQQKNIAAGMQKFPPGTPYPHNFTYLPQYPWYPWARDSYMMYGPQISNMWYSDPFSYNPRIANQIYLQQLYGNTGPATPIGPYYPQGFMPLPPSMQVNPPLAKESRKRIIKEKFTDSQSEAIRAGMIYFIFFLVALAVILCVFMICILSASYSK